MREEIRLEMRETKTCLKMHEQSIAISLSVIARSEATKQSKKEKQGAVNKFKTQDS